jgi:hypothetical protein
MKFQMWWHLFLSLLAGVLGFLVVEISTVSTGLGLMVGFGDCGYDLSGVPNSDPTARSSFAVAQAARSSGKAMMNSLDT